jgi:hypothetical protein
MIQHSHKSVITTSIIRCTIAAFCFVGLTGCMTSSFLAPSMDMLSESGQPMGGLPLPGDQVYKKSRFTFNPPPNTRGWILFGSDDLRVSMFSPRSRTWISGGYLPLKSDISFSDKKTFMEKYKEAEVAYLTGKESETLTDPALHQEFENLSGEMDCEPRKIGVQTFYVSEYFADLWIGDIQTRQKIFLYLLPGETLRGMYVIAMVAPEAEAKKGQLPMKSFVEVVNNFITKK